MRADSSADDFVDPVPVTAPRTHRLRKQGVAALAAVATIVVAALVAVELMHTRRAGAGSLSALRRTSWQITSVRRADGTTTPIPKGTSARVSFLDARHATGDDTVNAWNARYTVHGSDITFIAAAIGAVGHLPGHTVTDVLVAATQALLNGKPVNTRRTGHRLTMTAGGYVLTLRQTALDGRSSGGGGGI